MSIPNPARSAREEESSQAWQNTRLRFNPQARHTTPAQKKEILRRDGWKCQVPACPNGVWLDIHHVKAYSEGGETTPMNCRTLCSCHRNHHRGYLKITPDSEGNLVFQDNEGRRLDQQADLRLAGWIDFWLGWTGNQTNSYTQRAHSGEWSGYACA